MNIFNRRKQQLESVVEQSSTNNDNLAEVALLTIHDGVIITDDKCAVQYINPAAVSMTEISSLQNAIGLDYELSMTLEDKDGRTLSQSDNEFTQAMRTGQTLEKYICFLIQKQSKKKIPIAISVAVVDNAFRNRVVTFRNVAKELEEENKQADFISTASHEMRTPVASIEGYIALALNPQTATIDARARGYLESAEKSSKHLGRLFQDLLDITKLDDGRLRPHPEPVEITDLVRQIVDAQVKRANDAGLSLEFGKQENSVSKIRRIGQVLYCHADTSFLQEIVDNLIENAIKYTKSGGSIRVEVRGDDKYVIISVADTGIGIPREDIKHIFQKFYRVDNSDTRTIGGTGLGLYLTKQRVESMNGRIWVESVYGSGSVFYVSLPRLSSDEYERLVTIAQNTGAMPLGNNTQNSVISPPPIMGTQVPPAMQPLVNNSLNNLNNNPNGGTK